MKRILLATVALSMMSAGAVAADMEAPLADYGWDGFYIGVHGGYGWGDRKGCTRDGSSDVETGCVGDFNNTINYDQEGWLAGAQGGYNYAFDNILIGFEVDASLTGIDGTSLPDRNFGDPFSLVGTGGYDYLATAMVRLGWAFDRALVYGKVGYGIGGYDFSDARGCSFSQNLDGLAYGGGVEYKVSARVSAKLEWVRYDFDSKKQFCSDSDGDPVIYGEDAEVDTVKFGFNYNFGN